MATRGADCCRKPPSNRANRQRSCQCYWSLHQALYFILHFTQTEGLDTHRYTEGVHQKNQKSTENNFFGAVLSLIDRRSNRKPVGDMAVTLPNIYFPTSYSTPRQAGQAGTTSCALVTVWCLIAPEANDLSFGWGSGISPGASPHTLLTRARQ